MQLLAKALKACRKDKNKAKRVGCEKRAQKKYGVVKKQARKAARKASNERRGK